MCSRLQDGSGSIEYEEFRKVWTKFANVKQELLNRGITDFPKWAPRSTLENLLEETLIEEEKREVRGAVRGGKSRDRLNS